MRSVTPVVAGLLGLACWGCAKPAAAPPPEPAAKGAEVMKLTVTSDAFKQGESIPAKYTCQGNDTSPPLAWTAGPAGTVAYALIADDPDAPNGDWVHWVAWDITDTKLAEGAGKSGGTVSMGRNSWGKAQYGGPCPPSGTHRYYFKVFAMSAKLALPEKTDKAGLLSAMQGKVLAQGELMGTYQKAVK